MLAAFFVRLFVYLARDAADDGQHFDLELLSDIHGVPPAEINPTNNCIIGVFLLEGGGIKRQVVPRVIIIIRCGSRVVISLSEYIDWAALDFDLFSIVIVCVWGLATTKVA